MAEIYILVEGIMAINYNLPTAPGLYFAKKPGDSEYRFIVNVVGDSPFLKISNVLDMCSHVQISTLRINEPDSICWGPQVHIPQVQK